MTQKPVHVIAASGKAHGHQAIWNAIRAFNGGTWTIRALYDAEIAERWTIESYVDRLLKGALIEIAVPAEVLRDNQYRLLKDTGHHAPKLRADGLPSKQGSGTQNMWRSMRMLKEFDSREIMIHSTTEDVTVSENTAKAYCRALMTAGYLRVTQKARPGVRTARYRLVRDDGPLPPKIQRVRQVFDPNSRKSYPMETSK